MSNTAEFDATAYLEQWMRRSDIHQVKAIFQLGEEICLYVRLPHDEFIVHRLYRAATLADVIRKMREEQG